MSNRYKLMEFSLLGDRNTTRGNSYKVMVSLEIEMEVQQLKINAIRATVGMVGLWLFDLKHSANLRYFYASHATEKLYSCLLNESVLLYQ